MDRVIEVILPVLDEAAAIPGVLAAMPHGYVPLIVDNGSSDGSAAVAGALGARVVHAPQRGFGAACFAGLEAARSEIVCFMDCDGSLDPRELPRVAGPISAGSSDLCLGARVASDGAWPWHARLANRALALEVRRRAGVTLRDIGPMRAARRESLLALGLADRGFGWPLEMVLKAADAGWAIDEVQVGYGPRAGGRSKVTGSARGTARAIRDMGALLGERRGVGVAGGGRSRAFGVSGASARVAGVIALAAVVIAAVWIAVGASAAPPWLELPPGSHLGWIAGPLRGIGAVTGGLSASSLSLPVLLLAAAYGAALALARTLSLRLALGAVALANLAFTLGPTIVSSDVFGYIAYAREWLPHGLNPYVSAPAALGHDVIVGLVYWKHEPSPYGPLFTILSAPLGWLSPAAALWIFKAAAGLAAVAIAGIVARLANRRGLDPARAAIFVGLNPVTLLYAVSGAHNDLLAMALVVGAVALALDDRPGAARPEAGVRLGTGGRLGAGGRPARAGAAVVAAAAVKVTVGLALPFVVLLARRRGRAVTGAAVATAVMGVAALALFGPHLFDQLRRITTQSRFDIAGSGPDFLSHLLGTGITPAIRTACTGGAGVVAVTMVARAWRGADPIAAWGWAVVALLASIASLAPWYLVWLLPAAALGRSRGLWVAGLVVTAWLLGEHLPLFGGHPWLSGA